MALAHVLFGLLTSCSLHGYELKRAHDEGRPGAKPLGYGQVYATLNRLVRDGLAVEAGQERGGEPDRTQWRRRCLGLCHGRSLRAGTSRRIAWDAGHGVAAAVRRSSRLRGAPH